MPYIRGEAPWPPDSSSSATWTATTTTGPITSTSDGTLVLGGDTDSAIVGRHADMVIEDDAGVSFLDDSGEEFFTDLDIAKDYKLEPQFKTWGEFFKDLKGDK